MQYTTAEVRKLFSAGPQDGIFTDGSAQPNPGPGGWGFVAVQGGTILAEKHGHAPDTTNNRMELTGIIEALSTLPADAALTLYTDSELCVNILTKWAAGWEKRGWRRKDGEIKNLDLVKEAYRLAGAHPGVSFKWIKAHNGWLWNEYADALSSAWTRSEV